MRSAILFLSALAGFSWNAQAMELTSKTFEADTTLPKSMEYDGMKCDGENTSPQLGWKDVPAGTKSFALLMHDPDAPKPGGWWHWSVYNIPADVTQLEEGKAPYDEGTTSFGETGWGGMCPPIGHGVHHYNFTLYALDVENLKVTPGDATPDKLQELMKGHILGEARLTGLYER